MVWLEIVVFGTWLVLLPVALWRWDTLGWTAKFMYIAWAAASLVGLPDAWRRRR
jgi:hypothetical protein